MGKKIVAFGEVVWDILPDNKVLGGTPSNLVFRCNSLGENAHLLSRVGDDKLGNEALERLQELGIDTNNVQIDTEFPTGTVNITFKNEEPQYKVKIDVAFDHIEFSAEALKLARNADCLFFGLLPLRFGLSKNTIRELIKESPGSIKFFDLKLFEHFFDVKLVQNLLKVSNVVRVKEKEIDKLITELKLPKGNLEKFGKALVKKYQLDMVIVTRGEKGVFVFDKNEGALIDPGYSIKMCDNIGSGIAFAAGFLHYYLNKQAIIEAIRFGNAAGALNATKLGGTSAFTKNDVVEFMKIHQRSLHS